MYPQLLKNIFKALLCLTKRILSAISCGGGARSIIISELDQFAESPKPHTSDYLILPQKEIESEKLFASKALKVQRLKVNIWLYLPFIRRPTIHPGSFPGSLFYLFEQRLLSFQFEHFVRFIILCHFRHFIGHYDWPEFVAGVQGAPGPGSGSGLPAACQSLTKPSTAWSSIFNEWLLSSAVKTRSKIY